LSQPELDQRLQRQGVNFTDVKNLGILWRREGRAWPVEPSVKQLMLLVEAEPGGERHGRSWRREQVQSLTVEIFVKYRHFLSVLVLRDFFKPLGGKPKKEFKPKLGKDGKPKPPPRPRPPQPDEMEPDFVTLNASDSDLERNVLL
jgi:hypothetical protein